MSSDRRAWEATQIKRAMVSYDRFQTRTTISKKLSGNTATESGFNRGAPGILWASSRAYTKDYLHETRAFRCPVVCPDRLGLVRAKSAWRRPRPTQAASHHRPEDRENAE